MHQTRKRTEKSNSKANLAKTEVITAVVSSEVSMVTNMKDWVVDSGLPGISVGTEVHLLPIPL
ncbi:hypothetical protein CK203_037039 [Vitis vinifera]|uniref:Uncharacterized protein n=1 Tax=Vitis vinifera TaxID=29760 RepID=A0A438I5V3_VITVI|nr:hypothetical protein CK203_037039 [Vitis vinifera]